MLRIARTRPTQKKKTTTEALAQSGSQPLWPIEANGLGLHHPCQIAGDGLVAVHDGCEATGEIARDSNLVDQFRRGEEVLVVHPQLCTTRDLETRESHGLHVLLQESLCAPTVSPNECVERGIHF